MTTDLNLQPVVRWIAYELMTRSDFRLCDLMENYEHALDQDLHRVMLAEKCTARAAEAWLVREAVRLMRQKHLVWGGKDDDDYVSLHYKNIVPLLVREVFDVKKVRATKPPLLEPPRQGTMIEEAFWRGLAAYRGNALMNPRSPLPFTIYKAELLPSADTVDRERSIRRLGSYGWQLRKAEKGSDMYSVEHIPSWAIALADQAWRNLERIAGR